MKSIKTLATMFVVVMLTASVAVADPFTATLEQNSSQRTDVTTAVTTMATGTGGTGIGTGGKADVTISNPRQLVGLQYGTNFLTAGTPIPGTELKFYYSPVLDVVTAEESENMRRKFQLADMLPWNWKIRVHETWVNRNLSTGAANNISMMQYWPKLEKNPGDKIIKAMNIDGDVNWVDEAYVGIAAGICMEAGSNRYAISFKDNFDGVSRGASVSLGGVASQVAGAGCAGSKGTAVTSGGQLGVVKTTVEARREFEVLCMNPGSLFIIGSSKAPPTDVKEESKKVCDPNPILMKIRIEIEACKHCPKPCLNNEIHRKQAGDAYAALYKCTGEKKWLLEAIKQYEIAERDYVNGYEPDGTKTRSLAGAQDVMFRAYRNWSWCVREYYGKQDQHAFAKARGLKSVPTSFNELN